MKVVDLVRTSKGIELMAEMLRMPLETARQRAEEIRQEHCIPYELEGEETV